MLFEQKETSIGINIRIEPAAINIMPIIINLFINDFSDPASLA